MSEKYRIAVIDDHPLVLAGAVRTLEKQPDFKIVGEGECCDDAVRIAQDELPDIMLLDVSMPGGGINAVRRIAAIAPVVKTVMLTVSEDEATVSAALDAGARGYILKGIRGPDFVNTLRSIAQGDSYVSPGLAARLLTSARRKPATGKETEDLVAQLSARETTILSELAKGKSNRDIGEALGLTERTVKHYMTNILQKLQVRNRLEAALKAERQMSRDKPDHSS
jgi:two-component system nitrate/nitrite response regulator NarL